MKKCKVCKKPISDANKSGLCSNCGSMRVIELFRKHEVILRRKET